MRRLCLSSSVVSQGNTCYQNAILQQIYANPHLREGILNAAVPPMPDVEQLRATLMELRQNSAGGPQVAQAVAALAEASRQCGRSYLFQELQAGVCLSHRVATSRAVSPTIILHQPERVTLEEITECQTECVCSQTERVRACSVASLSSSALAVMMWWGAVLASLKYSVSCFFDPCRFVDQCGRERLFPFDVRMQQDASEFYTTLVQRLEEVPACSALLHFQHCAPSVFLIAPSSACIPILAALSAWWSERVSLYWFIRLHYHK